MQTFHWIVVPLLGAALLSALARRLGAPYPTFRAIEQGAYPIPA